MDYYFLNTGTITKASSGRDILRKNRIWAYVKAANGNLAASGCGYGIVIRKADKPRATALLQSNRINIISIMPTEN